MSSATTDRMPALYLSYGAPPLADDPVWTRELAQWSRELPTPRAILIVSAHWEEAPLTIGATTTRPLVYDFWGFPERYYTVRYPAPGAPQLAERVRALPSTVSWTSGTRHRRAGWRTRAPNTSPRFSSRSAPRPTSSTGSGPPSTGSGTVWPSGRCSSADPGPAPGDDTGQQSGVGSPRPPTRWPWAAASTDQKVATFSSFSWTPSGSSLGQIQSVVPAFCRADLTWSGEAPGLFAA